jgi:ribosomal subunit interface protein
MNLRIKGLQHMELTDAIRSYVTERASALGKFGNLDADNTSILAEVGPTSTHHKNAKDHFQAEFTVQLDGQRYFATETDQDMYAAIDKARDELVRQVQRSRSKHRVLWRKGHSFVKRMLRRGR